MNSMIGKLVDKEMVPHSKQAMQPTNSKHQFGFKPGVSCNNASVLLTEAIMEAKDNNQTIYSVYMDTSKAFDMVHESIMQVYYVL